MIILIAGLVAVYIAIQSHFVSKRLDDLEEHTTCIDKCIDCNRALRAADNDLDAKIWGDLDKRLLDLENKK